MCNCNFRAFSYVFVSLGTAIGVIYDVNQKFKIWKIKKRGKNSYNSRPKVWPPRHQARWSMWKYSGPQMLRTSYNEDASYRFFASYFSRVCASCMPSVWLVGMRNECRGYTMQQSHPGSNSPSKQCSLNLTISLGDKLVRLDITISGISCFELHRKFGNYGDWEIQWFWQ